MAGLLGFNPFNFAAPGPVGLKGLLAQQFDPKELRYQAGSEALTQLGLGLLSPDPQAPSPWASGLQRGFAGAAQGAHDAEDRFYQRGLTNYQLSEYQRQQDQRDTDKTAAIKLFNTLPPNIQTALGGSSYAEQYPADFMKAVTDAQIKAQFDTSGSSDRFSGQPYWGQDPVTKKYHWYQMDRQKGGASEVVLPNGVEPAPPMNYYNTGTDFTGLPSRGLPPAADQRPTAPIDNAGKSQQEAIGKGQGEAAVSIPQAENAANLMLSSIDSLLADPYLDSMLGPVNSYAPNISGSAHRVQSKMDQIQGQAFLQAYNYLRGGGQITEVEGQKATEAMARMAAAQNLQDYRQAAAELRQVIVNAVNAVHAKAGQDQSFTAPAQTQPQNGQRTTSGGITYTVHP